MLLEDCYFNNELQQYQFEFFRFFEMIIKISNPGP